MFFLLSFMSTNSKKCWEMFCSFKVKGFLFFSFLCSCILILWESQDFFTDDTKYSSTLYPGSHTLVVLFSHHCGYQHWDLLVYSLIWTSLSCCSVLSYHFISHGAAPWQRPVEHKACRRSYLLFKVSFLIWSVFTEEPSSSIVTLWIFRTCLMFCLAS